jgi:hypothetical protein
LETAAWNSTQKLAADKSEHEEVPIDAEISKSVEPASQIADRGKKRSTWLNAKLTQHPDWSSDKDIAANRGPSYNTIQRYRSGATSTQDLSVRKGFAKAFQCEITEVPE